MECGRTAVSGNDRAADHGNEESEEDARKRDLEKGARRRATHRGGWWPGWIWAVPLAALGVAGWLVLRSWTHTGPEVKVVFPEIANLKAGDTKVKFEGMEIGQVEDVSLEPDLKHLRATLSLEPVLRGQLGPGTRFWIKGKQVSLAHISDIRALVTGVSIGIDPSPGKTQAEYQGLGQAPVLGYDAKGTRYVLHTDRLGSVQRGTPVYYRDQQVGQVVDHEMTGGDGFLVTVFVDAPHDRLVHGGTRFWRAGPVHLSTGGAGPTLQFQSIPALFEGALAFETPDGPAAGPVAAADHGFELYSGEDEAEYAPDAEGVAYRVVFHDASGVPTRGAAVKLMGERVGSVSSAVLEYSSRLGTLDVRATILLEPHRIALADGVQWTDPRAQMDALLRTLVTRGLEAQLSASPPVIGGQEISLAMVPNKSGMLGPGPEPEIPAEPGGGGVGGIMASAGSVMAKVNGMPLDQIADNLRDISRHLAQLTSSPALASTLRQVDRSTENLARITGQVRQQLPPTLDEVRRTVTEAQASLASAQDLLSAQGHAASAPGSTGLPEMLYEITRTARSLRELSGLLDRQPSSVLTGRDARP